MDKRKSIIKRLNDSYIELQSIFVDLQEENQNGHQFDYCISDSLSNNFDKVENVVKKIDNIIYQKI